MAPRRIASPPPSRDLGLQLATAVDAVPEGERWVHEVKLDGYRILARIDEGRVALITRSGLDWTERFGDVAELVAALPVRNAILDGEIVRFDREGRTDFQALQNALRDGTTKKLVYVVFDLLFLDGRDLRDLPLVERKALLADLLAGEKKTSRLRYSDHVERAGESLLAACCERGLEGIVSKRADARYRPGRNTAWVKVKCTARQELVVGGFTEPRGARAHLGALLVGVREGESLRYAGKVGSGFSESSLKELAQRLRPLGTKASPFVDPPRGAAFRDVHWVRPELVAEVEFAEFTDDGRVRHGRFLGLRDDKSAREVVRERPRHARGARGGR